MNFCTPIFIDWVWLRIYKAYTKGQLKTYNKKVLIIKNLYMGNFNLLQHTVYMTWIQLLFEKIGKQHQKTIMIKDKK